MMTEIILISCLLSLFIPICVFICILCKRNERLSKQNCRLKRLMKIYENEIERLNYNIQEYLQITE